MMDDIIPYGLKTSLIIVSIGVVLLNIFKVLLNAFRTQLLLYLGQKLDISLILGYYRHVLQDAPVLTLSIIANRVRLSKIGKQFFDFAQVKVSDLPGTQK